MDGEHMTIYERLDDETKRKLNAVHRPQKKDKRKYSERDIKELMGVNRDTYKRSNGRVKRK